MGEFIGLIVVAVIFIAISQLSKLAQGGKSVVLDDLEPPRPGRGFEAPTRPPGAGPPPGPMRRPSAPPATSSSTDGLWGPIDEVAVPPDYVPSTPVAKAKPVAAGSSKRSARRGSSKKAGRKGSTERTEWAARRTVEPSRYIRDLSGGNVDALRRAFVLSEILGPPASLKDPEDRLPGY